MLEREYAAAPVLLNVDGDTYLRRFVVNDAPLVVATVQEHAGYIGRSERWAFSIGSHPDPQTTMNVIGLPLQGERGESYGLFHRGRLVGGVALHSFCADLDCAKLGYWRIDNPEVRGKGLVTRAARQVVHMGLARLGLTAIGIEIARDNTASRQVAKRLGAEFLAVNEDDQLTYVVTGRV